MGQAELKEALLAVAANDALDGLLVRGEKGTAKSTAVRALTDLLPPQEAIADCPYGCPPDDPDGQCDDCRDREDPPVEERPVPLVTLPLGATRERVVGTLSVEKALDGDPEFDPGLLARANRGILYVDEVNLLDDHLVDVLLDAAASGVNRVERDGVSVTHPADFTIVGTMNPEEGDLRPQLRDRFALQATVVGCQDVEDRVAIIEQALDRDAAASARDAYDHDAETADLRETLRTASALVDDVELPADFAADIAELCRDAGVDGHRADIATARAAMTFAALDDRPKVLESDVRKAAELTLPHRLQSKPFEDTPDPEDVLDDHFDDEEGDGEDERDADDGDDGEDDADAEEDDDAEGEADDSGNEQSPSEDDAEGDGDDAEGDGEDEQEADEGDGEDDDRGSQPAPSPSGAEMDDEGDGEDQENDSDDGDESGESEEQQEGAPLIPGQSRAEVGEARAPDIDSPEADDRDGGTASGGSRSTVQASASNEGARVRTEQAGTDDAIDAAASVRAAASRGSTTIQSRDLRRSVRAGDTSALVVFAVDASASMRGPMRTAKGVAIDLLQDAYEQRDEVALVAFAGEDAEVLLPPTDSVTLAARHLKELPTGDRTPLPAGMQAAGEVIDRADPDVGIVVLVTDGRPNTAEGSPTAQTRRAAKQLASQDAHVVVVDAGRDGDRSALTADIAAITDGEHAPLSALSPERVEQAVASARDDAQR
ncbi:VWA domain-containing protein [Haloarculaceae archaeon H-GB2-1]|nr:VWA domain-containing protein [Haloarculaceae archaeon H-GB2-1]